MEKWQKVNRLIMTYEDQMSIEHLRHIQEFIESVIIIRSQYLSKKTEKAEIEARSKNIT